LRKAEKEAHTISTCLDESGPENMLRRFNLLEILFNPV
jgi:hypothetical protein